MIPTISKEIVMISTSSLATASPSCSSCRSQQKHPPKVVHFAPRDRLCEYKTNSKRSSRSSLHKQWYQPSDYIEFRTISKAASEVAIDKGFDDFLFRAYSCRPETSDDVKFQQKSMNLWTKSRDSQRGLERYICKRYQAYKVVNRLKLVQAVLYTQNQIRSDDMYDDDQAAVIIARVAKEFSDHSVHLATLLGTADRCAAESSLTTNTSSRSNHNDDAQSCSCEPDQQPPKKQQRLLLRTTLFEPVTSPPTPIHRSSSSSSSSSQRPPIPPSPARKLRTPHIPKSPASSTPITAQRQNIVPSSTSSATTNKDRLERKLPRVPISPAKRLEHQLQQKLRLRRSNSTGGAPCCGGNRTTTTASPGMVVHDEAESIKSCLVPIPML